MTITETRLRLLSERLLEGPIEGTAGVSYHPRALIGQGGQGWVYRAGYDEPDGPAVVVKMLRPDVVNEEALTRFLREADVLRKLGQTQAPSPNVVRLYDHGIHRHQMADGEGYALPFMVLEFVDGPTLSQVLGEAPGAGLAAGRVRRMFRQVARALALIHAAQIVHRDLKPSNLILTQEAGGELTKITDFGLVKRFDVEGMKGTMALAGASVGYAPPEQFELGNKRVSPRTDVFSFAAVLFEALTGTAAFAALPSDTPFQVLSRILSGPRPSLGTHGSAAPELAAQPAVVASLDELLHRALRPDPGDRPESILGFWEPVEALLRRVEVAASSVTRHPSSLPASSARSPSSAPPPQRQPSSAPGSARPSSAPPPATAPSAGGEPIERDPLLPPARLPTASAGNRASVSGLPTPAPGTVAPASLLGGPRPASSGGPAGAVASRSASVLAVGGAAGAPAPGTLSGVPTDGTGFAARPGALLPERAWSMALDPEGNQAYALGRFGLVRHHGEGWTPSLLPASLSPLDLRGVLVTPTGAPLVYGDNGALWGAGADGSLVPWAPADVELVWYSATLMTHPAEIVLVGEHQGQRVPVIGVLRPGQALSVHRVDGCRRLHGAARLVSGVMLACGEAGELVTIGQGPAAPVEWGRTGHLTAVLPAPDGGAHVVGSGGHALYVTSGREARLEPVQTTRDLVSLTMGPMATPWAGGQDARLLRRTRSGWVRVPLPASAQGAIRALVAGPRRLTALLDDGTVLDGASA